MEKGHSESHLYPIGFLLDKSQMSAKREMQLASLNANLLSMGAAAVMDKKAAKAFHKVIKELSNEDD